MTKNVLAPELIRSIAAASGARYLAPNITRIARDADCSATLVRRFLLGEQIGSASAARIRTALGLDAVHEVERT